MNRRKQTLIIVIAAIPLCATAFTLSSITCRRERASQQPRVVARQSPVLREERTVLLVTHPSSIDHVLCERRFTEAAKRWTLDASRQVDFVIVRYSEFGEPAWRWTEQWWRKNALPEEPAPWGNAVWIEGDAPIRIESCRTCSADGVFSITRDVFNGAKSVDRRTVETER